MMAGAVQAAIPAQASSQLAVSRCHPIAVRVICAPVTAQRKPLVVKEESCKCPSRRDTHHDTWARPFGSVLFVVARPSTLAIHSKLPVQRLAVEAENLSS